MEVWIVTQEGPEWKNIIGVYDNEAVADEMVANPPKHSASWLDSLSKYFSTCYEVQ